MGEIVEYTTTTIPLESLQSLLQNDNAGNNIITPAAYTTEDGETILILPQYSTLVVTGDDANALPVHQVAVQSGDNQTYTLANNSLVISSEVYNGGQFAVLQTAETGKNQSIENIGDANFILVPSTVEQPLSQIDTVVQHPNAVANDFDIDKFLNDDGRYHCNRCPMTFVRPRQLKRHINDHRKEKPLKCHSCTASFNIERNLILHEASHNLTPNSSCPICEKRFLRVAGLCSHLRIHQVEDTISCNFCKSEFEFLSELEEHMIANHNSSSQQNAELISYNCRHCSVAFSDINVYRKHMMEHRLIEKSVRPLKPRRRPKVKVSAPVVAEAAPDNLSENINESPTKRPRGRISVQPTNKCSQCGKSFRSKMLLERHLLIHTGERPFQCDQCDKTFNQKSALNLHKMCHSGEKPHQCQFCVASFTQRGNLRSHIRSCHRVPQDVSVPNVYRCQFCSCTFKRLSTYSAHLTIRHAESSSSILQTDIGTSRKRQKIVLPERPTTTTVQRYAQNSPIAGGDGSGINTRYAPTEEMHGKTLESETTSHAEIVEEAFENVAIVDPDTKSVQHHRIARVNGVVFHCCSFCEKRFRKSNDFVRHMRTHTREKPFVCEICNKRFTNKSTLTTHLRVHSGSFTKRYRCHVCRKLFASSSSLKVHLRVHTGVRPFGCTMCSQRFRTSSHRLEHLRRHQKNRKPQLRVQHQSHPEIIEGVPHFFEPSETPVTSATQISTTVFNNSISPATVPQSDPNRKYACPKCPKAYKKSDHLRYHVESAHGSGQRNFICQVCGKSFAMAAVLRNHIRTHAKHDVITTAHPSSRISQNINETACFDFVSLQQPSLLTSGSSRGEEVQQDAFNHFPVDLMCFHCGRSFENEEQVKLHVSVEHESAGQNNNVVRRVDDIRQIMSPIAESNTIAMQSWIPGADVLPELSLSLLQPPSVSIPNVPTENESLIETAESNPEEPDSPIVQHLHGSVEQKDDGPGLLEQVQAQEYPTIIIAGNMQQQIQTSVPPGSPIVTIPNSENSDGGKTRGILAIHHAETNSFEFRCAICGAVFYTKQSISRHMTDMHSNKSSFTCHKCNRQLSSSKALTLHLDFCDKKNANNGQFDHEIHILHDEHDVGQSSSDTFASKNNTCSFCNRSFSKRSDLVRHERTHTGDRPYHCQQCGRSFRLKNALASHQMTHLPIDERSTFSCHLCKATLGSKAALAVHVRRHTGVQPFCCPHCPDLKFTSAGQRQSHMTTAHIRLHPKGNGSS